MNILNISTAVLWVDFVTIALSKFFHLGKSLDTWYAKFGMTAVLSDCLVIILGILLAQFLFPQNVLLASVVIQLLHDYLFYIGVIIPIPRGHNAMIDLFKEYAKENSYKVLVADSLMIGSSVLLAEHFSTVKPQVVTFLGLLAVYALSYIVYTR
jgi:uncharacterized protein YacL